MEYWQQLSLGVFFGALLTLVVYYIFDRVVLAQWTGAPETRSYAAAIPLGEFRSGGGRGQRMSPDEVRSLIYEEYKTEDQENAAVILYNDTQCAAICAFQNEMAIEYFVEKFDRCCLSQCNNFGLRSVMCAVSHWGQRWYGAEVVNIIAQDRELVLKANTEDTDVHKYLARFEEQFNFRASSQWSGNFICHDADHEELWDELIVMCRKLLDNDGDADANVSWREFPVEHWQRRRVRPNRTKDFHVVPHAGHIIEGRNRELVNEKELISL